MRLNINIATQPYQDLRRVLFRWGLALAVLVFVTLALVYEAVNATISWRIATRQQNELRAQIAERDRVRSNAEAFLNQSRNRSTRDQSQFLNALIARKAFSWTEVLSDLERMVPTGIKVVGIKPEVNDNLQLELHLAIAGQSRDRAIELVRHMEDSQHFRFAEMRGEIAQQNRGTTELQFEISAIYVPSWDVKPQAPPQQQGGK